jgi:hypothetical protein
VDEPGGPGGSGSDTDHFGQYYKANAEAARAIVDTAISFWQQVIVDFNWEDGINHFDLDLEAGPLDPARVAERTGLTTTAMTPPMLPTSC